MPLGFRVGTERVFGRSSNRARRGWATVVPFFRENGLGIPSCVSAGGAIVRLPKGFDLRVDLATGTHHGIKPYEILLPRAPAAAYRGLRDSGLWRVVEPCGGVYYPDLFRRLLFAVCCRVRKFSRGIGVISLHSWRGEPRR